MTVTYDGNELHTLHIGHQKIQLSTDEIDEIVTYFADKDFFDDLEDDIETMKEHLDGAKDSLADAQELLKDIVNNVSNRD